MSSNVTQDQYEASIRAWRYEGGFIFASFLLLSYDAACNGSPNHSLTKDFLAALLQSIELQGGGDTLEDCTELFMSHIVMKDVELQSIQRMLKVIDDKQIMQFKISYLGIRKPRIGDWRDPRTIIGEMEGIPPTQTEYRLTDGVTHDIWLKSTQKELIICIRLSNKKLVGPLPYQGGDARLFAVQVDFDVMIAGNPSRLILPRPARRMQANLQLSRNRTVSFALPIDVLRDIGDKEFRVVVSLVTPYSVHEIASDWHESPLTVLSNLHYI